MSTAYNLIVNNANKLHMLITFKLHCISIKLQLTIQVTGLPSPRYEAQASSWCCMRSTFFVNSVNFLITWGLLVTIFHSTCIFCVYADFTVWHSSGHQHCSSMSACTYRLFAGTGAAWWVLSQHSIMLRLCFRRRVWYCAFSLRYGCIWSSGIVLIP